MKIISFLLFLLITSSLFAQKRTAMIIHFDFDKAAVRATDARLLDSLVATFPKNTKGISLEIYGHCDARGTEGYNDTLSVKRVKAVEKYLLARGFDLSLITKEQGYGKGMPITDHQDWMNRRVELIITIPEETVSEQEVENTLTKIIEDTATRTGTNIILKNLNFIGGSHHLLNSSYKTLNDLLNALKKNENLVIQIEGHICCMPDDEDGYDYETRTHNLSEERAKAIYAYLITKSIAPERLSYKGFGHSKPIYNYPEKSEQERILNRRVEIKIIKK